MTFEIDSTGFWRSEGFLKEEQIAKIAEQFADEDKGYWVDVFDCVEQRRSLVTTKGFARSWNA